MNDELPEAKIAVSWRMTREGKADLVKIAKKRRLTSQVAALETLIREEAERLGIRKPLHRKG